ncbi:baseplate J/gp47 family protein [Paraburkholderia kururiensis]|uniref:baseplate J/gp47 family protein n=1 Tax=Paraburkholderia kururiensis TaxID=984307 RepID=UPI0005AAED92|nr:baseplate J/gp47 family protein [Paraburkholderia kururiensis]
MTFQTQTFTQVVENAVAAVQGAASNLIDTAVGSVLRAILEANAAIVMWLQGLVLYLASLTRAATCSGSDLDSWMADYGVTRLPASYASGPVTFSRFTATSQATIPVGSLVQSSDGTQQYAVVADTTNPAYSATLNAFVIPAGTTSVTVTVQAVTAGAAGNMLANQVNALYQAIPGVDTVTNANPFTNGANAESDVAFRARFQTYIASLSKATKGAVAYAVTSIQQNVSYTLTENQTYGGATNMGFFYVVVDDGSGSPPSSFLSTVYNAINAVRPITSTFAVFAPVLQTANVGMTLTTTGNSATHNAVIALVTTALQAYINTLPIGASLSYSRLAQIAYDASPLVTNVTGVTLNGGTADLTATTQQIIKSGTLTIV